MTSALLTFGDYSSFFRFSVYSKREKNKVILNGSKDLKNEQKKKRQEAKK
jgi:hypothetical protein